LTQAVLERRLREVHGLRGTVGDFRVEEDRVALSFRGPAYLADVSINRLDGTYTVSESRMGLVALINDLHKGRDSGRVWSWVIDVSGVMLALVSITGLVLLAFLRKRRVTGVAVLLVGGLVSWGIALLVVP
jgi:hypothetical protein